MNPHSHTELLAVLRDIENYALEHCDEEADINNQAPDDMRAHVNGLIVQLCQRGVAILANETPDALTIAFVEGAKWWEYQTRGATMWWPSDQREAEREASRRAKNQTLGTLLPK